MRHGACKAQGDRRTKQIWRGKFGGQIETPEFPDQIYAPPTPPRPLYSSETRTLGDVRRTVICISSGCEGGMGPWPNMCF